MGFFDRVSTFFGGHGVKLEFTSIERQAVESAAMPMSDSVVKGQYRITFDKEVEILAHIAEVCLERKHEDGRVELLVLDDDRVDADNQVIGAEVNPPYTSSKGQVVNTGFICTNVDIQAALRKVGFENPVDAIGDSSVRVFIRVTVDVKGTILDADAQVNLALLPPKE